MNEKNKEKLNQSISCIMYIQGGLETCTLYNLAVTAGRRKHALFQSANACVKKHVYCTYYIELGYQKLTSTFQFHHTSAAFTVFKYSLNVRPYYQCLNGQAELSNFEQQVGKETKTVVK